MTALYGSTVGKKVAMALSGLVLIGFVFLHMAGDLKAFQGQEAFDAYALFIREFGYPLIPHQGFLWGMRIALLAAVGLHILAAWQLWTQSRDARAVGYEKESSQVFSYASRTMRWGGVIVLAFIVYHLLHFTTGTLHPQFEHGAAYDNLVIGFSSIPVSLFYLVAVGSLSLHLYHGIWSLVTTLGIENARVERARRPAAAAISIALFVGYAIVPLAVMLGILGLEG